MVTNYRWLTPSIRMSNSEADTTVEILVRYYWVEHSSPWKWSSNCNSCIQESRKGRKSPAPLSRPISWGGGNKDFKKKGKITYFRPNKSKIQVIKKEKKQDLDQDKKKETMILTK